MATSFKTVLVKFERIIYNNKEFIKDFIKDFMSDDRI